MFSEFRAGISLEFHGASVHFAQHAVGDSDILGMTAAKAKDRPAGAEVGVGHGDVLARAEHCARIVAALHDAVADGTCSALMK